MKILIVFIMDVVIQSVILILEKVVESHKIKLEKIWRAVVRKYIHNILVIA